MVTIISRRGFLLLNPVPPGLEEHLKFWDMVETMELATWKHPRTGEEIARMVRGPQKGQWECLVTVSEAGVGCCQRGLLRRIINFCDLNVITYRYVEEAPLAPFFFSPDVVKGLRPEQMRNLLNILVEIGSGQLGWTQGSNLVPPGAGSGGALISATMSTGKTVIISAVIRCFPHVEVLVVTKKVSVIRRLLQGLSEALPDLKDEIGVYYGGAKLERRITICSEALLDSFDVDRKRVIIHDEVHNSTGQRIAGNLLAYHKAIKIGFSGTIEKHKRLLFIESIFGPIVDRITDAEAESLGRVSPLTVYVLKTHKGPDVAGLKEHRLELQAVTYNHERNLLAKEATTAIPPEMQTIVFVRTTDHLDELKQRYLSKDFVTYHGGLTDKVRENIEKDFCEGKILRLVATDAFSEGVDTTHVRVICEWGPSSTDMTVSQRGGRARRRTEGKAHAILITPSDDWKIETDVDGVYKENPMAVKRRARVKNYKDRGWPILKVGGASEIDFSTVNTKEDPGGEIEDQNDLDEPPG